MNYHTFCCAQSDVISNIFPPSLILLVFHWKRAAVAIDTASAASTAVSQRVLPVPSTATASSQSSLPVCKPEVQTAAADGKPGATDSVALTAFWRSSLPCGIEKCPQSPFFSRCPAGFAVGVNDRRHTQGYGHGKRLGNIQGLALVPWRGLQWKQAAGERWSGRAVAGRAGIQHPAVFGRRRLAAAAVLAFENFQLFWKSFLQLRWWWCRR